MTADFKIPSCPPERLSLYVTKQRNYVVGSWKSGQEFRLLKISRLDPNDLDFSEDPGVYSKKEIEALTAQIHSGNLHNGGLQKVCEACGIIGCFRLLDGIYLLLITKRRYVGSLCGQKVYGIEETALVPLPNPASQEGPSSTEKRYRKLLLSGLELTRDFFFSYSYGLPYSLQANQTSDKPLDAFASMFTWNEYLSKPLRDGLASNDEQAGLRHGQRVQWILPLIHGFWQQRTLSVYGRTLTLTVVARRSKHFAGTRYRKRGVNDQGQVANDVEIEQLVCTGYDAQSGRALISSVVQMRGSIPLYWHQEGGARLKPDILVQHYDPLYYATRLHFQDLKHRYGNPLVVLNLVKRNEKRPREMWLGREFEAAIEYANKQVPEEERICYVPWDFHAFAKQRGGHILADLQPVIQQCLDSTGLYTSCGELQGSTRQQGVLRTNCIDCVDRTNVAQYAFGALALGRQLQALGFCAASKDLDPRSSLSRQLMAIFESMGHSLARQYGGSEAHATFFQRERGNWEAATQSRDLMTTLRRFYSNTYTDAEKQDAMNLFLGHFIPRPGHANIWDLDSDYYLHSGWPVTGQAMGMGTSHPKQLQSIPESPSHPQATMDSSPGNHLSSHLEQQGDHLLGPSTSQPSHAAAAGLDQAGRAPFEPIRESSSSHQMDDRGSIEDAPQLLPVDPEPPDSGQRLEASESMIRRLLPEKGRGFDHMASSSGSELEEAAEDSEPEEDESRDKSVPPQPRIGGSMRLRDRFPRPQAGLAQPSLPKPASASSLPDIARTGNDLAPKPTPIPHHNSQSALSTALHHKIGPAVPKDQQSQPTHQLSRSPTQSSGSPTAAERIQPAQARDASNKAALTKSASADAAGSGVHEALQAADGAAPASGQDHGSVGAKRGRRAGLAITPPSAVEVLGLPALSNPAKRLKLESFDTMIGKAPNTVHHVCLSPPMEPVQRAALPQWLSTPLTLPRLRSMEPSPDGTQGMLSYWPSFGPLSQLGSPLDRTRSSSLSGSSQPSRQPSMLPVSPTQAQLNSIVMGASKLPAGASPASTPGKLPLDRIIRTQTLDPGDMGQRLVQSARGPNKQRSTLSRRPKSKEDPPMLLVLDAGEASVPEDTDRGAQKPKQPAIRRAVSMDLHVDYRQMHSLRGDRKASQGLQRTSSTDIGKTADRRASMEHQLPRRYVTFPSTLTQPGQKGAHRQPGSAPAAQRAVPRRPASDTNISGLRPQSPAALAQAQREGQGPQAVLDDIARRPTLRRPERAELQSLGLTATAQTCWGTASGCSEDLAWLSNPAVKAMYTRNLEKAVGMASTSARPQSHSSYKRLIKPQGMVSLTGFGAGEPQTWRHSIGLYSASSVAAAGLEEIGASLEQGSSGSAWSAGSSLSSFQSVIVC